MGSATESNAKPQIPMAENDKKTFKKLLKVFFKKDKKKEKLVEPNEVIEVAEKPNIAAQAVENVLQKIEKLNIRDKNEEEDELENFSFKTVEIKESTNDEFENFTYKTVKDDCRNDRSDSHSSEDSGFAEKLDEEPVSDGEDKDDVITALEKLTLDKEDEEKREKEKRVQTVVVARTPIRQKIASYKSAPYYVEQTDPCRQVQINKQTLTGGQVIVNRSHDLLEVDAALKQVQQTAQHSDQDEWFSIINEVIQEDSAEGKTQEAIISEVLRKLDPAESTVEEFLSDFFQSQEVQQDFYQAPVQEFQDPGTVIMTPPHQEQSDVPYQNSSNPIEEFSNNLNYELFGDIDLVTSLNAFVDSSYKSPEQTMESTYNSPNQQFIFPTPPHSENAASPMSDSQSYRTSEYSYSPGRSVILSSPERSSPIGHSDYEKFQEIPNYEDSSVNEEEKKRERNNSTSSMTMKQYKDLQKELSHSFSKKDCCQLTRKSCKQLFQEHLQKLTVEERKNICLKVAKMDLKHAYGVLQNILRSLSQSSELEDLQHAVFCLLCERVLRQQPAWFLEDFGLNLLKSAALRCPQRPLLSRHAAACVRAAARVVPAHLEGKDSVFHEVDAMGDTLLTALARRGDAAADVLAEIVKKEPDELPLFRIHHLNGDGASALHVACCEHAAGSPRLHIVHVLLEHGGADLWQGDAKAGDTPVHVAVNSKNCDLHLLMVMFKHVDRKLWKKLAHAHNMCSTTPLEYARSATKSQVRDGYPAEVLEFLKKCR